MKYNGYCNTIGGAVVFLLLLVASASAWVPTNCGGDIPCDCGAGAIDLNESRVFNASDNLTNCDNGLIVSAANVVLDCDGYGIVGGDANTGITVMADNVTVKNCCISEYATGIQLSNVDDNTMEDNNITNNTQSGIRMTNSSGNTVGGGKIMYNNRINGLGHAGVLLEGNSTGNTITGVYLHDNTRCAVNMQDGSDSTLLDGNHIDNNGGSQYLVYMIESDHVTIKNNNITDGSGYGIYMTTSRRGCYNATIRNNNISGNTDYGVYGNDIEDAVFRGNDVNWNEIGLYLVDTDDLLINNNDFRNNTIYGVYMDTVGNSGEAEVKDSGFYGNGEGMRIVSTSLILRDSDFTDNQGRAVTGLYLISSTVDMYNGNFENNGKYGLYEGGMEKSVYWRITDDIVCRNNNIAIGDGWVSTLGGSMTATSCTVTIGGEEVNFTGDETGYLQDTLGIPAGGNQTVNTTSFSTEVHSTNGYNATLTIKTYDDVPSGVSGYSLTKLGTWVEFNTTGEAGNMSWVIIKIYYTDAEVTAAGLQESSLAIEYYNATSDTWETFDPPNGGVNTTANYVWANSTHFSGYGVFGSPPPAAPAPAPSKSTPTRGSSDTPSAGPAPSYGYETEFSFDATAEELLELMQTDENVQSALEDAGVSREDFEGIAALSGQVSQHFTATIEVDHVSGSESELTLVIDYTGEEGLEGEIVVIDIPKSFASSASSISVDAGGATVVVTNSDPVFTIVFGEFAAGTEKVVRFTTESYVNRNNVRSEVTAPVLFTQGYAEVPLATPPAPVSTPEPTVEPTPEPTLKPEAAAIVPPAEGAGLPLWLLGVVVVIGAAALFYWTRKK